MRANTRRDTGPELAVRRLLHASGLRYRVDWPLPFYRRRRADIAFTSVRVVVFIDGCFWHGCPEHYVPPATNPQYWKEKVADNRARDTQTNSLIADQGWAVLRYWEHGDPEQIAMAIRSEIQRRR